MYDDENPLVIAMSWLLAGALFSVFILVKLGVTGSKDHTQVLAIDSHIIENWHFEQPEE